jgi:hypothetical protein
VASQVRGSSPLRVCVCVCVCVCVTCAHPHLWVGTWICIPIQMNRTGSVHLCILNLYAGPWPCVQLCLCELWGQVSVYLCVTLCVPSFCVCVDQWIWGCGWDRGWRDCPNVHTFLLGQGGAAACV